MAWPVLGIKVRKSYMRILIFSPEKPYTGAESIVTGKLMRAMLNRGWEVDMIYHETEMMYSSGNDVYSIKKYCHGIENKKLKKIILRQKSNSILYKSLTSLDSALWAWRSFRLARRLRNAGDYNLIISRIMPQYGHLPALLYKVSNSKTTWFANWSDPLPRGKSPAPYGQGPDAKTGIISLLYVKLVARISDHSTFPSERLMGYYMRYLSEIELKSSVLPHVLIEQIDESIRYNISDGGITLTHLGGFGVRNPENLIYAYKKLREQNPNSVRFKFRFIGHIDDYILQMIAHNNLTSEVSLEGIKSYEETLEVIRNSDMMLVVEAPLSEGIFLPSKVVDYLQYGKPILAISPRNGVMSDLIYSYGGGILADCSSVQEIYRALLRISGELSLIREVQGIYNTENLKSIFSEKRITEELWQIYKKHRLN
jgi:hypothetical protein